ncbi:MAG: hypothetical protein ABWK01_08280 [Infirmifilum sp.]
MVSDTSSTLIIAILALGVSIGVLAAFIYLLRFIVRELSQTPKKSGDLEKYVEKLGSIETAQQTLSSELAAVKNSLNKIQEGFSQLESKVTALEGRVYILEKRKTAETVPLSSYTKPARPITREIKKINDVNEIGLYFPEVKYAGIITSQGYIVKSYGQCSEEPPKLLEVLRVSNMEKTTLVRSNRRIELFRLGDVKDLTIYGILEFEDGLGLDEARIEEIRETIGKYFRDVLSKIM